MPKVAVKCKCGKGAHKDSSYCFYCKDEDGYQYRKRWIESNEKHKQQLDERNQKYREFSRSWSGGELECQKHFYLHSGRYGFDRYMATLDCPICCGLPPWEWGEWKPHTMYVVPRNEDFRYDDGSKRKYELKYIGFNWRTERSYGKPIRFMAKCSVCGEFKECARHDIRSGNREAPSTCLSCIKKENRQQSTADQEKEVNRLLKLLRGCK